jgi:hypothetical protein
MTMEPTFATRWFYANIEKCQVESGPKTCLVCGLPTLESTSLKEVLRKTFTDYDVLRVRGGRDVCPACVWYFDHQELRRSGWWLTAFRAESMKKSEWLSLLRQHVETGAPRDAYYLIKPLGLVGKHLALYAPLTMAGSNAITAQFNTLRVKVDASFLVLVEASHRLREFHSWKEIRTGNYYAKHILTWIDRAEFIHLRSIVQPWLNTSELALAEFVWSKEKME